MVEIVGNAVRTAILRALSQQPMTGRELARTIDVGHTTVQRYLTHLETHGLVRPETSTPAGRRQGQHVVWSVDRDRITEVGQQWIAYAAALDVPDSNEDQGESDSEG